MSVVPRGRGYELGKAAAHCHRCQKTWRVAAFAFRMADDMLRRICSVLSCILAVSGCACQKASTEGTGFKGLFGIDNKAVDQWFPAAVRANETPEVGAGFLDIGESDEVLRIQITLRDGDTLRQFRIWSGMTDKELLAPNPGLGPGGFRNGAVFVLAMTQDRFDRFSAKRENFHRNLAAAHRRGETVIREVLHVVAEGETLEDIVARHATRTDSILRLNPGLRMRLPYEGQQIRVPILAEVEKERRETEDPAPASDGGVTD